MRRFILILLVIAVVVVAELILFRRLRTPIPEIAFEEGNDGFQYRTYGDESMVSLETGSLVPGNPTTPEQRRAALEDFLRRYNQHFNVPAEMPLSFAPATGEFAFTYEDQPYYLVSLYQTHQGAPIIDQVLYGGFARLADGAVELRMVRGQLHDTAGLPSPPPTDDSLRRESEALFRDELAGRVIDASVVDVSETPVISARFDIAGYLVRRAAEYQDGAISHLAAVVNPQEARLQELYDQQIDAFDPFQEERP